jgi:hypothetical protein
VIVGLMKTQRPFGSHCTPKVRMTEAAGENAYLLWPWSRRLASPLPCLEGDYTFEKYSPRLAMSRRCNYVSRGQRFRKAVPGRGTERGKVVSDVKDSARGGQEGQYTLSQEESRTGGGQTAFGIGVDLAALLTLLIALVGMVAKLYPRIIR